MCNHILCWTCQKQDILQTKLLQFDAPVFKIPESAIPILFGVIVLYIIAFDSFHIW